MSTPPSIVAFEEALAEFTSTVTTQLKGQVELNALLTERVLRLEQRVEALENAPLEPMPDGGGTIHAA